MPAAPPGFAVVSAVFPIVFGIILVAIVGAMIYRTTRMARRGQNPLTLQEDLAYQASRSEVLRPGRTKAERLAELDALRAAGTIDDAEHAQARARILAE